MSLRIKENNFKHYLNVLVIFAVIIKNLTLYVGHIQQNVRGLNSLSDFYVYSVKWTNISLYIITKQKTLSQLR